MYNIHIVTPNRTKISTIELITSHEVFMQEGLSSAGNDTKEELHRIIEREKALEHQNIGVIEKLDKLPLGSLSQHVRAELELLKTANSPSDRSIMNWEHHVHQESINSYRNSIVFSPHTLELSDCWLQPMHSMEVSLRQHCSYCFL